MCEHVGHDHAQDQARRFDGVDPGGVLRLRRAHDRAKLRRILWENGAEVLRLKKG
jgi:hypothetical protein